ncbi:MAG: hypothetical protein KGI37_01925 [Alphaproteobacteria bacterium]|nr:hypothetical protein [Alphaproteobacteria bacterium]
MSSALSIAVGGINASVARATQSATNIVNASSTGNNLDANLVSLNTDQTDVAANAAVIRTVKKMDQSLLDILA